MSGGATQFTDVIVCKLPDSYATGALGIEVPVDMERALSQHRAYVDAFKLMGVHVTVLEPDEEFPDCVFVEDAAIVVHGHALLTQPGDPSRRNETLRMKQVLKNAGLIVMEVNDPEATLDGGDVLYTGREILVGQSKRTNRKVGVSHLFS